MKRALLLRSDHKSPTGLANSVDVLAALLRARGFSIARCEGLCATREAILAAYDRLIAETERDDAAVVYYAGHGGLVENQDHDSTDLLPRFLQVICPSDYDESTETDYRGIMSFELSLLLSQLAGKTDNATVILESCYSLGLSRRRGPLELIEPVVSLAALRARLETLRQTYRNFDDVLLHGNPNAIRISASGQYAAAFVNRFPRDTDLAAIGLAGPGDGSIGAMTLAFAQQFVALGGAKISWRELGPDLQARLASQRPEVEGPIHRIPFTLETADGDSHGVVRQGTTGVVDAGQLVGIAIGDVFAVMPAGSQVVDPAAAFAHLPIAEVSATQSRATAIAWRNGHHDWPSTAIALAVTRVSPRDPVRVEAPSAERPVIEHALAATGRLRIATPADAHVLAEVRISDRTIELRDSLGPLFPPAAYPAGLAEVVADLASFATERRLRQLASDGGLPDDVEVTLGAVARGGAFWPLPDTASSLGLGDRIAIRLVNRSGEQRYANVFNLGVRRAITSLSPGVPGVDLGVDDDPIEVGPSLAGQLQGFRLTWPSGLARDQPRADTVLVIVTEKPADLRALETANPGLRTGDVASALQQLVASLATGRTRNIDVGTLQPSHYRLYWRDFQLFPIDAPLALGDVALDAWPPGGQALTGAVALRVRVRATGSQRVDVLVCGRTAGAPYRAVTVGDDETIAWDGAGPIDVYAWTSPGGDDRRTLADVMGTPAAPLLGDPLVGAGASLQLATTARAALETIARDVTTAFRASFDHAAAPYTTPAFVVTVEAR